MSHKPGDAKSLNEVFSNFTKNTSTHGVPNIAFAKGVLKKTLWSVVTLIATAGLAANLYAITKLYLAFPVYVQVDNLHSTELVFPAITVCNTNPIRKSMIEQNERLQSLISSWNNLENGRRRRRKRSADCTFQDPATEKCYWLTDDVLYQPNASAQCVDTGGQLAVVDTLEATNYLINSGIFNNALKQSVWIDLIYNNRNEISCWQGLVPATWTYWYGEMSMPDDSKPCVFMNTEDGYWSGEACVNGVGFFNIPIVFQGLCETAYTMDDTSTICTNNDITSQGISTFTTTYQATTPDITTIQSTTPDITTIQSTTPDITTIQSTTTDITTIQSTTSDITTSQPTTPDRTTIQPTTPDVTTSQPTTRDITTSQPTTRDITTSQPTTRDITTIQSTTPDITTIQPTTRDITTSRPTMQDITTGQPTTPDITTSQATTPNRTTSQPTTPEITTSQSTIQDITTTPLSTLDIATSQPTTRDITTSQPTTRDITTSQPTRPDTATSQISSSDHSSRFQSMYEDREPYREDFQQENDVMTLLAALSPEELMELGYDYPEMILSCEYEGKPCYEWQFEYIFDLVHGSCYIFNAGWNVSQDIFKSSQSGSKTGLKLIVNVKQEEYVAGIGNMAGVVTVVQQQKKMPFPEDEGVFSVPGYLTSVGIKKVEVVRLGGSYSNCSEAMTQAENIRKNIFADHYNVDYSIIACAKTCYQKSVIEVCGCGDPQYPLTGTALGGNETTPCNYRDPVQDDCMYGVRQDYILNNLDCDCVHPCRDSFYKYSVSRVLWPSEKEVSSVLHKYKNLINSTLISSSDENFFRRNLLKLNVYFEEFNYERKKEMPKYPLQMYVSDIGSVLGLLLGFTALTLMEYIQFTLEMIAAICHKFRTKQSKNKSNIVKTNHAFSKTCKAASIQSEVGEEKIDVEPAEKLVPSYVHISKVKELVWKKPKMNKNLLSRRQASLFKIQTENIREQRRSSKVSPLDIDLQNL